MTDIEAHLTRQIAFSRATFGPGKRTEGVIDHIRKELIEVEESGGSPDEWVDVVILALDGLLRSCAFPENLPQQDSGFAARKALGVIQYKQDKNELRTWPDWRVAPTGKAIEHERGNHD